MMWRVPTMMVVLTCVVLHATCYILLLLSGGVLCALELREAVRRL